MIIDAHAHLWAGNYEQNKAEMIRACEQYGISKVYVSGLRSAYPNGDEIAELNSEVAKAIREYPDHFGGYCYINPRHENALDVLKKGIEEQGMEGVKLWIATYCDDPLVFPIIEKCIDFNFPILIHAFRKEVDQLPNESLAPHVANLANRYPEAKILMAHLGGNAYYGIKPIVENKNVWVDISGSIFRRDELDYTVDLIGSNRVIFGSDMPGASYIANVGQVEEADLTDSQREDIYYNNAVKFFDRGFYV